jgi:hypothetical protein
VLPRACADLSLSRSVRNDLFGLACLAGPAGFFGVLAVIL